MTNYGPGTRSQLCSPSNLEDPRVVSPPSFGSDVGLNIRGTRLVHEDVTKRIWYEYGPCPLRQTTIPSTREIPPILPHDLLLERRKTLCDLAAWHLKSVRPPDCSLRRYRINTNPGLITLRSLSQWHCNLGCAGDRSAQRHRWNTPC